METEQLKKGLILEIIKVMPYSLLHFLLKHKQLYNFAANHADYRIQLSKNHSFVYPPYSSMSFYSILHSPYAIVNGFIWKRAKHGSNDHDYWERLSKEYEREFGEKEHEEKRNTHTTRVAI